MQKDRDFLIFCQNASLSVNKKIQTSGFSKRYILPKHINFACI